MSYFIIICTEIQFTDPKKSSLFDKNYKAIKLMAHNCNYSQWITMNIFISTEKRRSICKKRSKLEIMTTAEITSLYTHLKFSPSPKVFLVQTF